MAERGDDVLSLCGSDQEGSALSDFSGFEPADIGLCTHEASHVVVSHTLSKTKKGDAVTPGKVKPHASKKGKNKVSKQKPSVSSVKKPAQSVNVEPSALDIDKLTSLEISQLRELLGVSIQDEGPSIFDLYGDKPDNLIIERDYEGPAEDIEIIPEFQARPLQKQLKDALFFEENECTDTNNNIIDDNAGDWDLPKLKIPKKGDSVSPSLASLINTACTSQCEVDDIIGKHKIPANCSSMVAPSVNPEIWSEIARKAQSYDKAFQDIQTLIATGMVPMIKLVSLLKRNLSEEAKSHISDAITLLGQAQFNISIRRRYMIRPYLKKKYSPLCNITTPITNQLFGDDLSKEMKKCETSVSVARDNYNYGQFSGFRGQNRGRGRGRFPYRGYGNTNPGYAQQGYGGGRGYRHHPYARPNQFRQPQMLAPKKGPRTATVAHPSD